MVVVIPAYQPARKLTELLEELRTWEFLQIVVVDDGSSGQERETVAAAALHPNVTVLRHAINLGKGAALRTGFNHALCFFPQAVGVVTADADGQHHPEDIESVAAELCARPGTLILGARRFTGDVPLRSRFGNGLTRWAVRLLMGRSISDTQTGLRGVPAQLLPALLKVPSSGYEFELDMLITARHKGVPMAEVPIRTIYEDGNKASHFNPLLDSVRIYMVLLRFSILSVLTAAVDNLVFFAAYALTASVPLAQTFGRICAMVVNYRAARSAVFLSDERHTSTLPKYLLLVLLNGIVSYAMIRFLTSSLGFRVLEAKLTAEGILFLANFVIQRDLVFTRRPASEATDWTAYYSKTPFTAKLTRKYTTSVLLEAFRRFVTKDSPRPNIVEIGGANSCFLDAVLRRVQPRAYHVVDTNEYGLKLLRERLREDDPVHLHQEDVRAMSLDPADAVFSIGLIEHFDEPGTRQAIQAHLDLVRTGGYAILSYPTPTWLYRTARALTESVGLWNFPDERPLRRSEVLASIGGQGRVVFEKTLWPLIFTQHLIVVKKEQG